MLKIICESLYMYARMYVNVYIICVCVCGVYVCVHASSYGYVHIMQYNCVVGTKMD